MQKKHNGILIPSQRYQESRHLLQNPTFPNYVMGFSNRAQRFTGSNYLGVDSPFNKQFSLPFFRYVSRNYGWTRIFLRAGEISPLLGVVVMLSSQHQTCYRLAKIIPLWLAKVTSKGGKLWKKPTLQQNRIY